MIKCGDKLEGKAQCILYSKDSSKVLGRFPYSKHGGKKGARAAAHKREGQIQFFKKKSLEAAIEQFGVAPMLAYVAKRQAESGHSALLDELGAYVEKAKGKKDKKERPEFPTGAAGKAPPGYNLPKNWTRASAEKYWKSVGGSVTKCVEKLGGEEKAMRFCASLKDFVLGKKTWRKGRGKGEKKSFTEEIEEALEMLQKDEQTEEPTSEEGPTLNDMLQDVDLADLEQFLAEWGQTPSGDVETQPTETQATAEELESAPAEEQEPALEEVPEEWDNTFLNFIRVEHQRRQALAREAVLGPAEEE